eukprot:6095127-Amphidinium_carterae.1
MPLGGASRSILPRIAPVRFAIRREASPFGFGGTLSKDQGRPPSGLLLGCAVGVRPPVQLKPVEVTARGKVNGSFIAY